MAAPNRSEWDLLAVGAVAVDDISYVDHYPASNTKTEIRHSVRQPGGLAGTVLVAAARMGSRTAYCGVLGDDELSQYVRSELTREGVDCEPVAYRPEARPFQSFVVVDSSNGERTIFYSAKGVTETDRQQVTEELVGKCRVLFVDHTVLSSGLRAVEIAHGLGIPVVADFERWSDPRIEALTQMVDHLIVGIDFARAVTGKGEPENMARELAKQRRGLAASVVTAGDHGCWWSGKNGDLAHHPAFKVPVVDTIGCGDVFHGAYAAVVAEGGTVERAVHVASAAAAIKAMQRAGRSAIPKRTTIERFLKGRSRNAPL